MKRVSILLIVVSLIAGIIGCGGDGAEEPVYFPDANLEAAIREEIGKPTGDIYSSDLAELTYLDASSRDIFDVTGQEHCTSLMCLILHDNQISDISPLTNLTILTYLDLASNQISDIMPLVENEGLGERDEIYLADNPLSDDSINIYIPQLEARGVTVDY
jgi:Leucine-rich repeat (LRR) protein